MGKRTLKPTALRTYYDALGALKEQEQTALAELHAKDPARLIRRFEQSVATVASYPDIVDPNSESAGPLAFHERTGRDLPKRVPIKEIRRTEHFASRLTKGSVQAVDGSLDFDFRYVDREIFPLRSTDPDIRTDPRKLDLLLANDADGLPAVAELKIGSDKPTYFALIQALMSAVELSSRQQLKRLAAVYPEAGFKWPSKGPFLDIYVIAFKPPGKGRFRRTSFEKTKALSEKLLSSDRVSKVIRNIAYIEALPKRNLTFVRRFPHRRLPDRAVVEIHLREAVGDLPPDLRRWMRRALGGGRYLLCSGAYQDESNGTVCPVTAAAMLAGFWWDGALRGCPSSWGGAEEPSPEVVEFAARFDLAAEEFGLIPVVEILKDALREGEECCSVGAPRRAFEATALA